MKPCLVCSTPCEGSRCPKHQLERPAYRAEYNHPLLTHMRRKVRREWIWCQYCQVKRAEHVDHVLPLSKGGRTVRGNLQYACSSCNYARKGVVA